MTIVVFMNFGIIAPKVTSYTADVHVVTFILRIIFILSAAALLLSTPLGRYVSQSQNLFGIWIAIAIHDTCTIVNVAAAFLTKIPQIKKSKDIRSAKQIISFCNIKLPELHYDFAW